MLHKFVSRADILSHHAVRAIVGGWRNYNDWPMYHKGIVCNKHGPMVLRPPITQGLLEAEPDCWYVCQLIEYMPGYLTAYIPGDKNEPIIAQESKRRYSIIGPLKRVCVEDHRYLQVASHNTTEGREHEILLHNVWCHSNQKKDGKWECYMGCNFAFLIRVDFNKVEPSIGRVEGMFDSSERAWDTPKAVELTAQVTGSDPALASNDRTIGPTSEEEFTRNTPVPIAPDGREYRIPLSDA